MLRVLARTSGFTLIELIVGMMIFAIGMTGILALLHSTINNSLYSRHEIVAANLLREEIELVKNIRNSNVRNVIPFDRARFSGSAINSFMSGSYIIENNYTATGYELDPTTGMINTMPVTLSWISLPSSESDRFIAASLYLDQHGRFTHTPTATGTVYASYIMITPLQFRDGNGILVNVEKDGKAQWYILDARVLVQGRGYKEYDLKSLITDWK